MNVPLTRVVKKGLAGLLRPPPSLFDFCCAGLLGAHFIEDVQKKIIFFVFYIIFVLSVSLFLEQKRQYKNFPLAFFVMWSLLGVFVRSYTIPQRSIVLSYINLYLMSEGFIYVLFGSMFLMTMIRYSKNTRFIYLLIPILFYPWIKSPHYHQYTWSFALAVSILLYLLFKKRYKLVTFLSVLSGLFVWKNYDAIWLKFTCRPDLVKVFIEQMKIHPIIGTGFERTFLTPENMIAHPYWGWLYRHNDFFSLGAYLGIPALIALVFFTVKLIKETGINHRFIMLLTIILIAFFQMTVFYTDKAISYLLILGLIVTENLKQKESGYV